MRRNIRNTLALSLLAWGLLIPACVGTAAAQVVNNFPLEGRSVCVLDLDAVADTDWHTLTSADLYDAGAADGTACAANRPIASVTWVSTSAHTIRFKLRARAGAGDATANRLLGPANTLVTWPTRGVTSGGAVITSISYAKGNAAQTGQLIVVVD